MATSADPPGSRTTANRVDHRLWLIVIVVVGALLRASTIGHQSFWDDELFTLWLLRLDLGEMLRAIADSEATPPLYYVATRLWSAVAGTGEIAVRIPSVLAGTAAIPIAYAAARQLASRSIALWVAAFVALNPYLVWYGQEARSYAFLVPLTAAVVAFFLAALRRPSPPALAGWAFTAALALATHYFSFFVVALTALGLLLWLRLRRAVLAAIALPAATGILLLPLLLHQRASVSDPGGIGDVPLIVRAAAVPKAFLVGYKLPGEAALALTAAVLVGALVVLAWLRSRDGERRLVILMTAVSGVVVSIPLLIALAGADYVTARNLIPALIPLLMIAGVGAEQQRVARWLGAGLLVLSLVVVGSVAAGPLYQRKDWRSAAAALGHPDRDRVLVFSPGFTNPEPFFTYYARGRLAERGRTAVGELAVLALASVGRFETGVPRPPRGPSPAAPPGFRLTERRYAETFTLLRYRAEEGREQVDIQGARALALGPDYAVVIVQPAGSRPAR